MGTMKTPGVYIVEKNAFPNSVVEVATAVPAFIGYTAKAADGTADLHNKPKRITSMAEFHNYFGVAPDLKFSFASEPPEAGVKNFTEVKVPSGKTYYMTFPPLYNLYYNMRLFYANGGGACYVVSVGDCADDKEADETALKGGIELLLKEQEPTMLVIPEAVNLEQDKCYSLQQVMLEHCGNAMKNRFALLDVWGGTDMNDEVIQKFREGIGSKYLSYGAAYFPWLKTSLNSTSDLSYESVKNWDSWIEGIGEGLDESDLFLAKLKELIKKFADDKKKEGAGADRLSVNLHAALMQNWADYSTLFGAICDRLNLLPPSAAMAGIYTMVDNTRGVWKAPANLSISSAVIPTTNITNVAQEELNVPINGKAINAIRFFVGDGIKVWGARTLDGNSLDWRYINVRRTMIFLEESVKNAARAYVFEPNDANTWINIKSMIENFLRGVWKRGGLAGASAESAYSVHVGLGDTMTPEDILEGILRVTVLVAISRPAEFIEITFQQQMQES